jgi:hypothetical protein
MSAKLIAGLLAACVVAVGGVVLYHGDCPFSAGTCSKSAGCPTSACTLEATGACCSDDEATAPCCATKAITAKASCCSEAAGTCEPVAAAFGGVVAANTK